MEIKRTCRVCRGPASVYMRGKNCWYVACECAKTKQHETRDDAISAWNAGLVVPACGKQERGPADAGTAE